MGAFKKIISVLSRPLKNWNLEHRAHRLVEKQDKGKKPAVAPKYPSRARENFTEESRESLKLQQEKNTKLHEMLQGIVVNPERVGEIKSKSRPLPEHRGTAKDDEFGFADPTDIPEGRFSLRQSLVFIANHQTDPTKHTVESIAKEYNLKGKDVDMVLKYFQTLQIQLPKNSTLSEGVTAQTTQKYVESGSTDSSKTNS